MSMHIKEELWKVLQEECDKFTPGHIDKLIRSMQMQVKDWIKNRDGAIHY